MARMTLVPTSRGTEEQYSESGTTKAGTVLNSSQHFQFNAQDTVVGYTLTFGALYGYFRGLQLLLSKDGVVTPVSVSNTGYLRARVNES